MANLTTIKLPKENPEWIYEGTDPDLMEPVSADVTNRAPKQVQSNIKKLRDRTELEKNNEVAIVVEEFENYDSSVNYMKGDIVKDSDSNANTYYSIANDNKGNDLTDTDYWKPYFGIMPTRVNATRSPDKDDKDYSQGQPWVNTDANRVFMKINTSRTDDAVWVEVTNNGDTDLATAVVDDDYDAKVNTYLLCRTSDSTDNYTVKLPDSPADMDLVKVGDYDANAENNPVHIDGNGNKIEGDDTLDCDVNDFLIELTWNDKESKWVILNK